MKTNRLTPPIVAAIGIVLSLMAVGGLFYFLIKPTQDSLTEQQARYDQNYPDSTQIAQKNAQNLLNANKQKVLQTKLQWAQVEGALMPPYDVSDRPKAWRQLTYELGHYLGPDLNRHMKSTGVTTNTIFALPAPPASPNDITAAPLVIPLGTVNVYNGSFRQILTHFYEWQSFNRLVLVDGLTLQGNSPFMQGSYNATVYIFPQKRRPAWADQSEGRRCSGWSCDPRWLWRRQLSRQRWRLSRWTPRRLSRRLSWRCSGGACRQIRRRSLRRLTLISFSIEGFPAMITQNG